MRITLFEGRIVTDITHSSGSGDKDAYCYFRIAVKGNKKDESFFFNIEAFGKQADDINKYFKKGSPICLVTEAYNKQKDDKWYTNFRVLRWEFTTSPPKDKGEGEPKRDVAPEDPDIPF